MRKVCLVIHNFFVNSPIWVGDPSVSSTGPTGRNLTP